MDGFLPSLEKWLKEKTSSPLYFTYLGFFVAWNWKFFQIIFFESSSLFTTPRVEYILRNFTFVLPTSPSFPDWLVFLLINPLTTALVNSLIHFVPPALFTVVAIVYFPVIQKWALRHYLESFFERKRMYAEKKVDHDGWVLAQEKKKNKTLREYADIKIEQAETRKEITKAMTREEEWDQEFDEFKLHSQFENFQQVIDTIYKESGVILNPYNNNRHVSSQALALADTWNLIVFGKDAGTISLTDKGKYFAKKFLNRLEF